MQDVGEFDAQHRKALRRLEGWRDACGGSSEWPSGGRSLLHQSSVQHFGARRWLAAHHITLADDHDGNHDSPSPSTISSLNPEQCADVTGSYFPSAIDSGL